MKRILVTGLLGTLGAAVGAVAAPILSVLATAVAEATTSGGRISYDFSSAAFAAAGALGIPALSWLLMRRVPLWRAVSEPMIGAMLGMVVALATIPLLNPPLLVQPLGVVVGALAAALRLRQGHRLLPGPSASGGTRVRPAAS